MCLVVAVAAVCPWPAVQAEAPVLKAGHEAASGGQGPSQVIEWPHLGNRSAWLKSGLTDLRLQGQKPVADTRWESIRLPGYEEPLPLRLKLQQDASGNIQRAPLCVHSAGLANDPANEGHITGYMMELLHEENGCHAAIVSPGFSWSSVQALPKEGPGSFLTGEALATAQVVQALHNHLGDDNVTDVVLPGMSYGSFTALAASRLLEQNGIDTKVLLIAPMADMRESQRVADAWIAASRERSVRELGPVGKALARELGRLGRDTLNMEAGHSGLLRDSVAGYEAATRRHPHMDAYYEKVPKSGEAPGPYPAGRAHMPLLLRDAVEAGAEVVTFGNAEDPLNKPETWQALVDAHEELGQTFHVMPGSGHLTYLHNPLFHNAFMSEVPGAARRWSDKLLQPSPRGPPRTRFAFRRAASQGRTRRQLDDMADHASDRSPADQDRAWATYAACRGSSHAVCVRLALTSLEPM